MATELASYLVKQGIITPTQADDMLQRQVLFGGEFDTQLLEAGILNEEDCLYSLSQVFDMETANKDVIDTTPAEMPITFPLLFAQMHSIVPNHFENGNLVAISQKPLSNDEKLGLERRLGVKVDVKLTTEVRFHYALNKLYGTELPKRFIRLIKRLDGKPMTASDKARLQAVWTSIISPKKEAGEGEHASQWRPNQRLDLKKLRQELIENIDRDFVVETILRSCLTSFEFSSLFVVLHGNVIGWTCRGGNGSEIVSQISLPLNLPSMLQTAILTESPYLGRVPNNSVNKKILEDIGRPWPGAVLLIPIRVRGKVVAVVYADSATRNISNDNVQDLLVLGSMISIAFEQLIRTNRQQLHESITDGMSEDPPMLDNSEFDFEAASELIVYDTNDETPTVEFVENPEVVEVDESEWDSIDVDSDILSSAFSGGEDLTASKIPDEEDIKTGEQWESVFIGDDTAHAQASIESKQVRNPATNVKWQQVIDEIHSNREKGEVTNISQEENRIMLLLEALDGPNSGWDFAIKQLKEIPDQQLVPFLKARFPGNLLADPFESGVRLPIPEELAGLLKLMVELGPRGKDVIKHALASQNPRIRFTAVYLMSRVFIEDLAEPMGLLLWDNEAKVRFATSYSMRRYVNTAGYERILATVRSNLTTGDINKQIESVHLVAQLRDVKSVPILIAVIGSNNAALLTAANSALLTITGQAFGTDAKSWDNWWQGSSLDSRIEWLISGLYSEDQAVRQVANSELIALSGYNAGFHPQANEADRIAAIERWKSWSASLGQ